MSASNWCFEYEVFRLFKIMAIELKVWGPPGLGNLRGLGNPGWVGTPVWVHQAGYPLSLNLKQ